jgi:membrane glycosyltransferase
MSDQDPQERDQPFRPEKPGDEPANASELGRAEIPLERERNSVRREQEGLKDRKIRRWAFLLVIGLLVIAVIASAAVIAVALAHGDYQHVASLVPVAGGAGWLGVSVWNRFSSTVMGSGGAESGSPE